MNAAIQYFTVNQQGKKVVLSEPPEDFPSIIDTTCFAQLGEGVAIALTMGEYLRSNNLKLPTGVLYEKAS
jgi:hypothetical protein